MKIEAKIRKSLIKFMDNNTGELYLRQSAIYLNDHYDINWCAETQTQNIWYDEISKLQD
jgi:hypothetical protein